MNKQSQRQKQTDKDRERQKQGERLINTYKQEQRDKNIELEGRGKVRCKLQALHVRPFVSYHTILTNDSCGAVYCAMSQKNGFCCLSVV